MLFERIFFFCCCLLRYRFVCFSFLVFHFIHRRSLFWPVCLFPFHSSIFTMNISVDTIRSMVWVWALNSVAYTFSYCVFCSLFSWVLFFASISFRFFFFFSSSYFQSQRWLFDFVLFLFFCFCFHLLVLCLSLFFLLCVLCVSCFVYVFIFHFLSVCLI